MLLSLSLCSIAVAQQPANPPISTSSDRVPPAEKLRQLKQLLDDPDVAAWIAAQPRGTFTGTQPVREAAPLAARIDRVRIHLRAIVGAFPHLMEEVADTLRLAGRELSLRSAEYAILLVPLTLLVGLVGMLLIRRASRTRSEVVSPGDDGYFLAAVLPPIGFAVGSALVVLFFDWPPVLGRAVVGYVLACVGTRLFIAAGGAAVEMLRSDKQAGEREFEPRYDVETLRFWSRRTNLFVGYLFFGWATLYVFEPLPAADPVGLLAAYILGLGLLAIAIASVWQSPERRTLSSRGMARSVAVSLAFVCLWLLWVAELNAVLWIGIFAFVLPVTVWIAGDVARVFFRDRIAASRRSPLLPVFAERVGRASVILVAIVWLASFVGTDTETLAGGTDVLSRLARGVLGGIAVLLIADLVWAIVRAAIDDKLRRAETDADGTEEARARRGRLLTLLPIIRNIFSVALAVIAILMVLASLGIEIAPLIAGAGVAGVAVGFGAQTVVKDVISGMFYLWDDAFRVGEYIQSGDYKGTVESFSLRSIKLRHHRGPLFTVPFGVLGAVQNMSRDWVIDVMSVNVPYDTDLQRVKAIVKDIGRQLQEAPEFEPYIIQTLKMKGVQQFGDFAMQLRLAMTTTPGQQFIIRRQAYAMMRSEFLANGIEIAIPTVQVASDGAPASNNAAAAHQASIGQRKLASKDTD